MGVWPRAGSSGLRDVRAAVILGVLAGLAAVGVTLPADAPAGQSSQATATPVAQVAAGTFHSCALLDAGTTPAPPGMSLRCWGYSGNGQLGYGNLRTIGDNEAPASIGPVDLGSGRTAKALAVGDYHTCAVLADGSVRCWGYGNEGQLGYGNRNSIGDNEAPGSLGPVNLGAGRTATAITAGGNHTCAILDDGNVRCWGLGEFGQLGYGGDPRPGAPPPSIGDTEDPSLAGPVNLGGHTARAITAGAFHTCAILDDASVRCWGLGANGQLGYGNPRPVLDPGQAGSVDLGQGRSARAITAGFAHTCAVLDEGSVRCWGLNENGQLGYGNRTVIGDTETPGSVGPVDLGASRTATAISAGGEHTCAVLDDGTVRCWGSPLYGQLGYGNLSVVGDNEAPASVGPVNLGPGRRATGVVAGIYHTCVRLDDRSVRCWGNGADGRLGLCNTADIGDNEVPAAVERVDIGFGGAACPALPASAGPGGSTVASPAPVATLSDDERALLSERARARGLRSCRAGVRKRVRRARSRTLRRYRSSRGRRALALRRVARRAARGRARCLRRFGRRPGRVTTLLANAVSRRKIVLIFRAAGSDGNAPPAARSYLVKQSFRPIRTRRDFKRAQTLCKGACTFDVTKPGATITLDVRDLRPRTTYYYSIAARDNVSKRAGPRSRTIRGRTG